MPRTLEAASAGSTDPPSSPDAMASPQHSTLSDGSTSSGYPSPHLSSASSASGYSWLLDRPPRLSPHPSSSGPPLAPLAPEIPPSPQNTESDWATSETYSPSDRFTPSRHLSSSSSSSMEILWWDRDPQVSVEPMSTPHSSASGGSLPTPHSPPSLPVAGGSLPTPHSPPSLPVAGGSPSETPPDNAEFFNKNMMKKLKIVAGVVIVGGAIAGIAGSQIKHRDCQDS
jgi:hypothetical protein